jgi:hypothetical protein
VKARKVKRLHPELNLADAGERIVRVRLAELVGFMPRAADPREVEALHDMRIAAKRLRYVLELLEFCFGPYARPAARHAKALQDVLGEIHDCDVQLPRVLADLGRLREQDAAALVALAGEAVELDPSLAARAPSRAAYRGLEALAVHTRARRDLLFARFLEQWTELERQAFRARLEFAVSERPEPTGSMAGDRGASTTATGGSHAIR